MDYRDIIFEPGAVARLTLNRPRYNNAQPPRMIEEMDDAFKRAVDDPQTRVVILSGNGDSFSAGHDLGTPDSVSDRAERGLTREGPGGYTAGRALWYEASMRWRNLPIPTIAMVHGYCIYGGWIFASAMDLVFASKDALFLPSHLQYFTVPWDLGGRKTKEILFEGRFITAEEGHQLGFVNRVYGSREDLERETLAYAGRVAESGSFGHRMVKFSVNNMLDTQGFTAYSDSAFHTYYITSQMRSAADRPTSELRRMPGVGKALDLLKRGFPAVVRRA